MRPMSELAKRKGATMAQVALAWSLANDAVSAPIVGTTSLKNLEEFKLIDVVHIELTSDDIKHLEKPYKPMPIIGFS
ncbi:hypothetical protein HGRIS_010632 [Hohenbuehelia grisea]|uniref:NADP-dependent oxidoreductase domain-containing protein n=1 Tax=Hohenbuehelia grisea TaxID=104357 RepID=A0ABR3IY20_9AGAR